MSRLKIVWRSDATYYTGRTATRPDLAAVNYYIAASEKGEPAGLWWGPGAASLGLTGEVKEQEMIPLFNDRRHPITGEQMGRAKYEFATREDRLERAIAREGGRENLEPERVHELERQSMTGGREARTFADMTFSLPKSWSVLHASLEAAGRQHEADLVWESAMAGAQAGLEFLQDAAGHTRAGKHGAKVAGQTSGRFTKTDPWVIAMWRQHTSRDGDPQLHIHCTVLNSVRCSEVNPVTGEAEDVWRTLDSNAIRIARPAAAVVMERVAEERLMQVLPVSVRMRTDEKGREIVGVKQKLLDHFSTRRTGSIAPGVADLVQGFEERHGAAPNPYQVARMAQSVTLRTRKKKPEHAEDRQELLARWEVECAAVDERGLRGVWSSALTRSGAPRSQFFLPDEVVERAVAAIQAKRETWSRYDLMAQISHELPDSLGGLNARQVTHLLEQMTDMALSPGGGVVRLTPLEHVRVGPELRRVRDDRSVFEAPLGIRYATQKHIAIEDWILMSTTRDDMPKIDIRRADALVQGTKLSRTQAELPMTVLTSGMAVDVIVAGAGTGKTTAFGEAEKLWREVHGTKTHGITVSEKARRELDRVGFKNTSNAARFLLKDYEKVERGDAIFVDEAQTMPTVMLGQIVRIAYQRRAKLVLGGDNRQVGGVGAHGMFGLLVEKGTPVFLDEVRRFKAEWEGKASLRLRAGDISAVWEYDSHGRIVGGERRWILDQAANQLVSDITRGKDALAILGTNAAASEFSALVRAKRVALGQVGEHGVRLRDGNVAGVGDIVRSRKNDNKTRDRDGKLGVANRDVWRVVDTTVTGGLKVVSDDGKKRTFGHRYVRKWGELEYGSTVDSALGRTVTNSYPIIDESWDRPAAYVGLTRGTDANIAMVITHDLADVDEGPVTARTVHEVLGDVLAREGGAETALAALESELDGAKHPARLQPRWSEIVETRLDERHTELLQRHLGGELAEKVSHGPVLRSLRVAHGAGMDTEALIARVCERDLQSADDAAKVLPWRIGREINGWVPVDLSYSERTVLSRNPADIPVDNVSVRIAWELYEEAHHTSPHEMDALREVASLAAYLQGTVDLQTREMTSDPQMLERGWAYMRALTGSAELDDADIARGVVLAEYIASVRTLTPEQEAWYQRREAVDRGDGTYDPSDSYPKSQTFHVTHDRETPRPLPEVAADLVQRQSMGEDVGDEITTVPLLWAVRDEQRRRTVDRASIDYAEALDDRINEIGRDVVAEQPEWLAAVPEGPGVEHRAGVVGFYRQLVSYDGPDPIGPAPGIGAGEARPAWMRAWSALGRPEEERPIASRPDGELLSIVHSYERLKEWAPEYVVEERRLAAISARQLMTTAVLQPENRDVNERLALVMTTRAAALDEIAGARDEWWEHTGAEREEARVARGELVRRGRDVAPIDPEVKEQSLGDQLEKARVAREKIEARREQVRRQTMEWEEEQVRKGRKVDLHKEIEYEYDHML